MQRHGTSRPGDGGRIVLSTPVTHSDWTWRNRTRIGRGKESVKYILDRCRGAGLRRIYWRCFDGGRALYASKLMDEEWTGYDADNYHAWKSPGEDQVSHLEEYRGFDSLGEAVAYGHEIGLEIHAWLSINEDDHAWGLVSRFSRAHPQFRWVKRSGLPYNSQLSFAFPEVRDYKLGLVREILSYDIDGVFFDWMRTGDVRNEPQATPDGAADFGYETPLTEGFERKHGVNPSAIPNDDEQWVRCRAEPQTLFMRDAHKLIKAKSDSLVISMMGHQPWSYRGATPRVNGNLFGLLIDTATWAREGLIDDIVAAGYYTAGGTPEGAYACMEDEVGERCNIWLYWWLPPDADDFRKSIETAEKLGAKQVLYWESDYLDLPERAAAAEELAVAMAEYAGQ